MQGGWGNQGGNQQQGWNNPNQGQGFNNPNQGQGWNNQNQGQQGFNNPNQGQGWNNPNQGQGFSNPNQGQGWNNSNQGQQGFSNPNQGQGWNNQNQGQGFNNPNQGQGWNNQNQGQGFNNPNQGQGWNNPNQGQQGQNQGFSQGGFVPVPNQLYRFVSAVNAAFVLDISQNKMQFNKLIIHQSNNGPNQKFALRPIGNGKYQMFCVANGLTVQAKSKMKGSKVVCSQPNMQQNQFMELVPIKGVPKFQGKNAFIIKCFGKCLDIEGGKMQNNNDVILWDHNGGDNQVWIIQTTY